MPEIEKTERTIAPIGQREAVTEDPELEVHDMGSTNGMLVDGHRISRTGLHDGSQVKIGSTTMTVRVVEGGLA